MAFGNAVTGAAFGVLNELLGLMRSSDGIAKPARYETIFFPPSGGSQNPFASQINQMRGNGTARNVSLKCENISMPGRNIDTAPDTNIYGPTREIAQGFSFADIDATFQLSSDLKEKNFFDTWQRLSFNPDTWSMGYYDDYTGALEIHQLDQQDRRRYGVQLIECFPKNIAEQSLSSGQASDVQKISVTFSYRYWKNLTDEADLPIPLRDRIEEVVVNSAERQIRAAIPRVLSRL